MTKGQIIKILKQNGIRKTHSGRKLESVKTFEVIKLYAEMIENDTQI